MIKKAVCQFIPIILIFLLLSQFKSVSVFAHTILGKILAIAIIVFYTTVDKFVGLFVCALFILFYQMDYVERMMNISDAYNSNNIGGSLNNDLINDFRKNNCQQNTLVYKDMTVKDDMAELIFPYLKFNDSDNVCNPCSQTCPVSIIATKIKTEDELFKPISTDVA